MSYEAIQSSCSKFGPSYVVITLPEAAEWTDLERRSALSPTLQLELSGNEENFRLRLSGPAGVKAFLAAKLAF